MPILSSLFYAIGAWETAEINSTREPGGALCTLEEESGGGERFQAAMVPPPKSCQCRTARLSIWIVNAGGPATAGSPPTGLPLKSRLVDDGPLAGSPDKEKPAGAMGMPGGSGGPQRGPPGAGWRRPNEWRGENEEGHEGWRPGNRQVACQLHLLCATTVS